MPAPPAGADSAGGPTWRDDPFLAWRVATFATLGVLAAGAWAVTGARTEGMDMAMGPGALAFFLVTWAVMMAAMMFPSVAPMVATYVSIQRGRRSRSMPAAAGGTALFVAGYILVWSAAGLLCWLLLRAGQSSATLARVWADHGRGLVALVLLAAAAYELTPAKYACLSRCRSPIGFVLEHWKDGQVGALRMGLVHGSWCFGCCWALMAALVALGVMSLGWMVLVALLIALEKLLPWRRWATGSVTGVLVGLAVLVIVVPGAVPGLTM
jgi:predicted metal-binding membrane protein